jgi:hypothetical protein
MKTNQQLKARNNGKVLKSKCFPAFITVYKLEIHEKIFILAVKFY